VRANNCELRAIKVKTSPLAALQNAIGYPEGIPDGAESFTFRVDGQDIEASATPGGAVRLVFRLDAADDDLPRLADFASGRILRDSAVLSVVPGGKPFLWQDIPPASDPDALRKPFEAFLDSCDWWRARLDGDATGTEMPHFSEVLIRP
jgi:hypothetical protein